MIRKLRSGKFWLKLIVLTALGGALLTMGGYVGLATLFNEARIQAVADAALAGTGRKLYYDRHISRSWLPRPTVTLRAVRLSKPYVADTDLSIGQMHIGLAWSSLFGQPKVEKWVWQDVDMRLYRNSSQQWNFDDLLARWHQQSGQHVAINRWQLRHMHIRVYDDLGYSHSIDDVNASLQQLSQGKSPFEAQGSWQRQGLPKVAWQAQGLSISSSPWQWRDVRVELKTQLPYVGNNSSQLQFDGTWQANNHSLLMQQVQWQWQSTDHAQLAMTGSGQGWEVGFSRVVLPQASALVSAKYKEGSGNATVLVNRLQWQDQQGNVAHIQLNGGWQNTDTQTLITAASSARWQANGQWQLDDVVFTSHQDTVNRLPNPRLSSELSGYIHGQGYDRAQAELAGVFDGQSMKLDAQYQNGKPARLSGALQLSLLSLRPYWPYDGTAVVKSDIGAIWRRWLKGREADWQVQIGRITSPLGQLDRFSSQLLLNQQQLHIKNLQADLYDGSSTGQLSLVNSTPLSWHWQQDFEHIQIKPLLQDALNFHNLSGQGNAFFDLTGQGLPNANQADSLNGEVRIHLQQGSWRGIDINNITQQANRNATLAFNEQSHTVFEQLNLRLPIHNGISHSKDIQLQAPHFSIDGAGSLDFGRRQMDYAVLVHTRQQAGQVGLLPLRVAGSLARPTFTLDYQRLTEGLDTPEQKEQALRQTLKQQWQWLNQGSKASSAP